MLSPTQSLKATDVIITAGPWTKTVWPGTPISALRAHSVTIRPSRPVSPYCLFTSLSIPKNFNAGTKSRANHVTPEIYARPDGTVYACGEGDTLVTLPDSSADVVVDDRRVQDVIDHVYALSPVLRRGEVLARQACYLPNVRERNSRGGNGPIIGKTKVGGLVLAAGHTCWGIQNSAGTGKLVSEIVWDGKATSADIRTLDPKWWGL